MVYSGRVFLVNFEVVETGNQYKPLIGQPGLATQVKPLYHYNSQEANEVHVVSRSTVIERGSKLCKEEVIYRYFQLFNGNLSESIVGFVAEIHLQPGHPEIFSRPYTLPVGMSGAVKLN